METPALPVIVIGVALLLSYWFGLKAFQGATLIGISDYAKGIYGTAIATMGMLSTAAYILAMDTFGPITDNAGGIIEMSNQPEEIRVKTDRLDAVGNTTKALTKGYAIGSAALAAFLLFSAYLDEVKEIVHSRIGAAASNFTFDTVNLANVPVFVAAMLGAMMVYLFSSLAIRAVGKAAQYIIEEVRRQFRENPGIMQGTSQPDYGALRGHRHRRRAQADGAARHPGRRNASRGGRDLPLLQRLPVSGGVLAMIGGQPVNLVGAESVAALLMVGTITGILLATMMNNGGGAWDNAKKFIETGHTAANAQKRTRPRWWAIPSAIPSRTPPAPRCTF